MQLRTLPSTVWLLGLVSLLNDSGSEMIYPLVPLYLASVLAAGPATLGLIEGLAETVGSLLKLFSGLITDRFQVAKPLVSSGYALAAISRPLFALATSWPLVLIMRLMDRLGKGIRTSPRDAMLAASIDPQQRGLAFGVQRAMDNLGSVIGPLLASWMLAMGLPWREIFLWAAIPGILAVSLTLLLREPVRDQPREKKAFSWQLGALPPVFRRYLWILALFTLGNSSNMFLLLRAKEMGVAEAQVPLLWGLTALVAAVASTPLSALSDRLGRSRLIVGGWLVYGLFYLGIGWQLASPWLLFAVYGMFLAATEGAEKALVADLAPSHLLGAAYGWFHLTSGLLLFPASLLFGLLWHQLGSGMAFVFAALCAWSAALLLARLRVDHVTRA